MCNESACRQYWAVCSGQMGPFDFDTVVPMWRPTCGVHVGASASETGNTLQIETHQANSWRSRTPEELLFLSNAYRCAPVLCPRIKIGVPAKNLYKRSEMMCSMEYVEAGCTRNYRWRVPTLRGYANCQYLPACAGSTGRVPVMACRASPVHLVFHEG